MMTATPNAVKRMVMSDHPSAVEIFFVWPADGSPPEWVRRVTPGDRVVMSAKTARPPFTIR
jgi:hypothetical protein